MSRDRGCWFFSDEYDGDIHNTYPGIRRSLGILMKNLISSRLLIPKILDRDILLEYNTIDELLDQIEASGYLEDASDFGFEGDTLLHTSNDEEVYQRIIRVEGFRTSSPSFLTTVTTDHWLPMMMDNETYEFKWNLELYRLNYHRIPALLKKLDEELGWKNEGASFEDDDYLMSVKIGYDFFVKESMIIRKYEYEPNPDLDLEAYLISIKKSREKKLDL